MIFKNYLKDPIATIAVNTTIFIAGCLFFGLLVFVGIVSEMLNDEPDPTRHEHLQQHADEQVKYDQMIQILDSINKKLD